MRKQTDAFIRTQGPQIAVKGHGNPFEMLADLSGPRVEVRICNRGPTPAYDFLYESWIELLLKPFNDFTASADYYREERPSVLYPGPEGQLLNIPIRKGVSPEELRQLRRLSLYACIRIRATYRDAFTSGRRQYSEFGLEVLANGFGFLPKYNGVGQC